MKLGVGQAINTLANVGVVAGIAFLVLEIQQNTDATRGATIQAISEQSYESIRIIIESPELREALRARNVGEVDPSQRQLLNYLYIAMLRLRQNWYQQGEIGILNDETSAELGTGGIFLSQDFAEFWSEASQRFTPGFQEYMNQLIRDRSERFE